MPLRPPHDWTAVNECFCGSASVFRGGLNGVRWNMATPGAAEGHGEHSSF